MSDDSSTSFEEFLESGKQEEKQSRPSEVASNASSPESSTNDGDEDIPSLDPTKGGRSESQSAKTSSSTTNQSPHTGNSHSVPGARQEDSKSDQSVTPRSRVQQMLSPDGVNNRSTSPVPAESVEEPTERVQETSSSTPNPDVDHDPGTLIGSLAKVSRIGGIIYWMEKSIESVICRLIGVPGSQSLAEYYYPSDVIRDDEEVVWASPPSRWQALGPYTLSLLFFFAATGFYIATVTGFTESYLNARSPSFFEVEFSPLLIIGIVGLLLFFGVITAVGQIFHRASTWYVVTDSRIIYRRNPINRKRKRINLDDINKADDRYPVPQRFVGIGSVDIYTASTDVLELRMRAVQGPGMKADEIDNMRAARSGDTSHETSSEEDETTTEESSNSRSGFLPF